MSLWAGYTKGCTIKADSMDDALTRVKNTFSKHGWGLPPGTTDIDMAAVFKSKGVDDDPTPYHMLGFCNPVFAHELTQLEPSVGVFLPCNVVVRLRSPGVYEVAGINPSAMLGMMMNPDAMATVHKADLNMRAAIAALAEPDGEHW